MQIIAIGTYWSAGLLSSGLVLSFAALLFNAKHMLRIGIQKFSALLLPNVGSSLETPGKRPSDSYKAVTWLEIYIYSAHHIRYMCHVEVHTANKFQFSQIIQSNNEAAATPPSPSYPYPWLFFNCTSHNHFFKCVIASFLSFLFKIHSFSDRQLPYGHFQMCHQTKYN